MFSKEEAKELRELFWHKLENRTRRLPGQKGKKIKWIFDTCLQWWKERQVH